MQNGGLNSVKKMEKFCKQEKEPKRLVGSFVLSGIFFDLAEFVEANPYKETIEGLEEKYNTKLDSYLESVLSDSSIDDQFMILTELIQLHWNLY